MSDGGSFQSKMAILVRSIPPLTQDLLTLGSRPMSGTLGLILMRLSCLSWNWRERSSVKITERTTCEKSESTTLQRRRLPS